MYEYFRLFWRIGHLNSNFKSDLAIASLNFSAKLPRFEPHPLAIVNFFLGFTRS